ncbi:hypothetical protein [Legionella drancourtii]|uniref:Uncharacterized protein n=1 Tax=Legionella drancourtii LLAP12 TaxID=658187 RepID=G9ELQ2_9GAMM|nr:hypothetical protein [Legionella drancourtii]EHL31887.1 hypothetical protein LDG_6053 [Legionella drancourtii LLAP12]
MPKGIIRVQEGATVAPEIIDALKTKFPDYELESYSLKPNYQQSYAKRIDILHQAFDFLVDAYPSYPLNKETLTAYAQQCRALYKGTSTPIDELQNELEHFTSKIIDVIAAGWNRSGAEAAELLNEAEQYVLMSQGRTDLATLTPMKLGKGIEYVLQLDESLPPHYEQIVNELTQIKAENYPKTPFWFRELAKPKAHFMQAYFCNFNAESINVSDDLALFLAAWKDIKSKALKISNDLNSIANCSTLPAWFDKLPLHHQEMMRVLAAEKSVDEVDEKLMQFKEMLSRQNFKNNLEQISKIPQWYWVLSEHQQYFLEKVLRSKSMVEEAVSFVCSRHRTLPMPANFARHSLYSLTATGEFCQLYSPIMRSSHIATREGIRKNWPLAVQRRHVLANLLKVVEDAKPEQVILFQTLVSPIGSDYIPLLSSIIPDFQLNQMARSIISNGTPAPPILQTNHPLNKAKLVLYTTEADPDVVAFLEAVEPYVSKVPGLDKLLENYKNVLKSGYGTATYLEYLCGLGRELFISSQEQLIISAINGYSYGSCVSGKDRKAKSIINTDAMYLYALTYNDWPLFEDTLTNRANFVTLAADLYLSRHQHEHAGQNAPGSEGLKTPYEYFPADITAEINRRLGYNALKCDDILASNNEAREISQGSAKTDDLLSPADSLLCQLVVEQLGEERCRELYDALYLAFNDMTQFIAKESQGSWSLPFFHPSGIPTGIQQIKDLMMNPDSGINSATRLCGIFEIIMRRPEQDVSRSMATLTVYKLRQLLKPSQQPESSFDALFQQSVAECNGLFNASKKEYLGASRAFVSQ